MAYYWLTPPSRAVFFISVLLAVLALLVRYAHVSIPVVSSHSFETLLIAFLLRSWWRHYVKLPAACTLERKCNAFVQK